MKTATNTETEILEDFKNASPEGKALLEKHFPKINFPKPFRERVKTFADICREAGEDPAQFEIPKNATPRQIGTIAFSKVQLITEMANEGWQPDSSDSNQTKYEIIWRYKAGSGFAYGDYGNTVTFTHVGARLQFRDVETARWAAETFPTEWNEYLSKTPIK
ncbi:MAG: hypothetical protein ACYC1Q_07730 [Bacteroidia bacterium]